MADDVKVLREALAMLAGDMPYNPDTIIAADIIVRRRLADSIEREEAGTTPEHLATLLKARVDRCAELEVALGELLHAYLSVVHSEFDGTAALDRMLKVADRAKAALRREPRK